MRLNIVLNLRLLHNLSITGRWVILQLVNLVLVHDLLRLLLLLVWEGERGGMFCILLMLLITADLFDLVSTCSCAMRGFTHSGICIRFLGRSPRGWSHRFIVGHGLDLCLASSCILEFLENLFLYSSQVFCKWFSTWHLFLLQARVENWWLWLLQLTQWACTFWVGWISQSWVSFWPKTTQILLDEPSDILETLRVILARHFLSTVRCCSLNWLLCEGIFSDVLAEGSGCQVGARTWGKALRYENFSRVWSEAREQAISCHW